MWWLSPTSERRALRGGKEKDLQWTLHTTREAPSAQGSPYQDGSKGTHKPQPAPRTSSVSRLETSLRYQRLEVKSRQDSCRVWLSFGFFNTSPKAFLHSSRSSKLCPAPGLGLPTGFISGLAIPLELGVAFRHCLCLARDPTAVTVSRSERGFL